MHLLKWNILLYLSFHIIGFIFCFASVLGIPGDLDINKPLVKTISQLFDIMLNIAWSGIPLLLLASLLAFYFDKILIAKSLSIISLILGVTLFSCLVFLYKIK